MKIENKIAEQEVLGKTDYSDSSADKVVWTVLIAGILLAIGRHI